MPIPKITWWIVWGALLSAVITYFVVLQAAVPEASEDGNWVSLSGPLQVVGVAAIAVSFTIRFLVTRRIAENSSSDTNAQQRLFGSYIVSLALAEAPAIFGLVLAFSGAPLSGYLTFLVAGFGTLLLQPPTFLRN